MQNASQPDRRKTVLVTGANGFIGHAVAKAFVAAGYKTFGLVRRESAFLNLVRHEIIPVLGSPDNLDFIPGLQQTSSTFDAIVSTTEDFSNYAEHCAAVKKLLIALASASSHAGIRPLVIYSSGCKDYGAGGLHSDQVKPFTEESALDPPAVILPRTVHSKSVLEETEYFDAVVTRPTTLFGGSSSYYGAAFHIAAKAAASSEKRLKIAADPDSIMHGTHVDDVARAYVQLAEAERSIVAGKFYNISSSRYETAREVADALVQEYGLHGVDFIDVQISRADGEKQGPDVVGMLFGFSQWVGSDKIRNDIGWCERRPVFSEDLHVYRLSYEAAVQEDHSNVARIRAMVSNWDH